MNYGSVSKEWTFVKVYWSHTIDRTRVSLLKQNYSLNLQDQGLQSQKDHLWVSNCSSLLLLTGRLFSEPYWIAWTLGVFLQSIKNVKMKVYCSFCRFLKLAIVYGNLWQENGFSLLASPTLLYAFKSDCCRCVQHHNTAISLSKLKNSVSLWTLPGILCGNSSNTTHVFYSVCQT